VEGHHQWGPEQVLCPDAPLRRQPVVDVDHVRIPEFLRQLTNSFLKEMIEEQNPGVKGGRERLTATRWMKRTRFLSRRPHLESPGW